MPGTPDTATPADVVARGLVEAWRVQCGVCEGGLVVEEDGLALMATRVPAASLNPAFVVRPPASPADAVAAIEEHRRDLGLEGHGFDLPDGRYADLEAVLADRGYVRFITRPAMWLPLPAEPTEPPADLDLRRVEDAATMRDWHHVQVLGFGMPYDVAAAFIPPAELARDDTEFYVGYAGGEPVTTSLAMDVGGSVGVFAVATVPVTRGRGYAAAATWRASLCRPGTRGAWLIATDAGQPVYRRMGYTVVEDWVVWERPQPPAA